MTRSKTVLAFALTGAILSGISARADENKTSEGQAPKAGGEQSASAAAPAGLELLQIDQVRSDLEISGDQEQKLIDLSLNPGAGIKELKKKAIAILTPQQRKRLEEIRLQSLGPRALADPVVVKALALTPEQCKMAKSLSAGSAKR